MRFTIDPGSDLAGEVRRIADVQVQSALAALDGASADVVEAVHDCRKRCKMLRGLVRLVRPALGDQYRPANVAFRDAARSIADLRDAHALLTTFDALVAAHAAELPRGGLTAVRQQLQRRSDEAAHDADRIGERLEVARGLLRQGHDRIDEWDLDAKGFDAIAGGVRQTYERGREALDAAVDTRTAEAFHDYRKRVKYSWYHVRLLAGTAPSILEPLGGRLHDLSDALGDAHDLAVLADLLEDDGPAAGVEDEVRAARCLLEDERERLERRAVRLGARLYAEKPKAFAARLRGYWDVWHEYGKELPAGEIGDLAPPDDGLDEATLQDLRKRARQLDVPGRSSMARDDLVGAIRAAGGA